MTSRSEATHNDFVVTDAALEAMAEAHDREDAAQRGEPSPWDVGEYDPEWVEDRRVAMLCAVEALLDTHNIRRLSDYLPDGSSLQTPSKGVGIP